ncbi:hypothetical protein [Trabulsiella odontotermitis]|nr:hypothetical protein [Trabulsiella odontotermitis]
MQRRNDIYDDPSPLLTVIGDRLKTAIVRNVVTLSMTRLTGERF